MELRLPEIYQNHAFSYKVTSRNSFEPRFLVLSTVFIYNVKMKSEKSRLNRRVFSFKERLWYHPIEALTKVELESSKKSIAKCLITMHFDLDLQNKILVNLKKKKQKKTERTFGFADPEACRIMLFELMRLFDEINKRELPVEDKFSE